MLAKIRRQLSIPHIIFRNIPPLRSSAPNSSQQVETTVFGGQSLGDQSLGEQSLGDQRLGDQISGIEDRMVEKAIMR